jgi:hypothetical protein
VSTGPTRRVGTALFSFLAFAAAVASPGGAAAAGFPPAPSGSPSEVWAVGDGADGSSLSKSVAEMIEARDPDRFLYLGDVYHNGTASEFQNNYDPVYGRFNPIAAPTPGNHEWGNRAVGYRPYWLAATGVPMPDYYTLRVGRWQVLSLNSETGHGRRSDQLRWLRQRLRSTKAFGTCRVAFWHEPRYSAGTNGDESDIEPLWDALAGRARIVLGAHDHDMQRFAPRRGIVQFISGAGGHSLREVDEQDPRLRFAHDFEAGALRLRLEGRRARYGFVAADGDVLDSGGLKCRRGRTG